MSVGGSVGRWVLSGLVAPGLCLLMAACGGAPEEDRAAAAESEHPAAAPDPVVAEVNGVPILAHQIEDVLNADQSVLRWTAGLSPEEDRKLRRKALDLIISGEVVYQAARALGLEVPPAEIDRHFDVARSQFASEEEFQGYLARAGMSPETLRQTTERGLLMAAYADSVTDRPVIDEARARAVYEEQKERFREKDRIHAAQILVRLRREDPPAVKREAGRRIEEAHRRALAGEDFGRLAAEFSEPPLAERGGDLGFVSQGQMLPEFDAVVSGTPVGEITPIFETPYGLNIVKVLERREGRLRPFEEVKNDLLLVLAREHRDDELRRRVERLRAEASIRVLDPELAAVRP